MVFDLSFRLINAISGTPKSYSMIHSQDVIDLRILFTSRISDDWTVQTISTKGQWTVIMWTFIWFEVFSTEWATITSSISHCKDDHSWNIFEISFDISKVLVLTYVPQKFQNDSVIGSESKKQSADSDANSDSPISLLSQLKYFLTQFNFLILLSCCLFRNWRIQSNCKLCLY